jgi:2-C-methyl-D-erythritol 2,4-cyclodiphosphate synthase
MSTRFGIGYDAHPLTPGVQLVLAGVVVDYDQGLAGHSDGDVATHAIIDALLGAAALGDVGTHFHPGDPSVPKGVSSLVLLERTMRSLAAAGWRVVNVDATIVAQRPRLSEHITAMRSAIARAMGTALENISVKATTEDGMGFTGSGQGISAMAVASVTELSGTELTS